mgnify:CR=1 FL=1
MPVRAAIVCIGESRRRARTRAAAIAGRSARIHVSRLPACIPHDAAALRRRPSIQTPSENSSTRGAVRDRRARARLSLRSFAPRELQRRALCGAARARASSWIVLIVVHTRDAEDGHRARWWSECRDRPAFAAYSHCYTGSRAAC